MKRRFRATLLWMLAITAQAKADSPELRIGAKQFTENIILCEVLTALADASGVPARGDTLGGTQIVFKALQKGDIDAYPEYTGTLAKEILHGEVDPADEDRLRAELEKLGIGMSHRLGFSNTYALGLKRELAAKLGITKISDLRKAEFATLRLGLSEEFINRGDGWPGLKDRYQLPQNPKGMDHNLAYTGLAAGSIDVTDLYSTDAEIRIHDLRLLEDDLRYFPEYQCVVLYRQTIEKSHPKFLGVLKSLEGKMNAEEMTALNAKVRESKGSVSEAAAAAQFVKAEFGRDVPVNESRWYRELIYRTIEHLRLVVESLTLAVVAAIPLGIWARKWPRVGQAILGVVGVLQTIPSMAVLVFMVPLLGLGARPAIVALFLYSLLPIVRNTYQGLIGIPESLKESAEVLGLDARARLWLVELPLASPSILSGIKTAAVINVGTATIGALIGAGGYGQPILTGIRLSNYSLLLQGAVPAALMAVLVQLLFDGLERFVVPKGLRLR